MNNFFAPQQTAHKLLDLSVRLRELGHLQCVVNEGGDKIKLSCSINGEEANQRVCLGGCVWREWVGEGVGVVYTCAHMCTFNMKL